MKGTFNILRLFLLAGVSLVASAESLQIPQSSGNAPLALQSPPPIPKLINPQFRAPASIEFQVEAFPTFRVLIESSADLMNWMSEGLWPPNTPLVFANTTEPKTHRFYRPVDYTMTVQGVVRDFQTGVGVEQAKVTLSDFTPTPQDIVLQTDGFGVFRTLVSVDHSIRTITVEKTGYDKLITWPLVPSAKIVDIPLWLAPPGYHPANDDFQNRFTLNGTNVTIQARTFAATSERGHELNLFYADYFQNYPRNLWWTWTAPFDGAVRIELTPAPVYGGSGVAVYTGASLPELMTVWDSGMDTWDDHHAENPFFVKKGVQYQIAFGTVWPAETGFTFRMVPPAPPVVNVWINREGIPIMLVGENLSLGARANGAGPMSFQWRKDGIDIPGATEATFRTTLGLQDAGSYSVRVSNEAGTTISDKIYITVLEQVPPPLELVQGTWTMETSQGPVLITFSGSEFTAKKTSDNSSAGSGHFTITSPDRNLLRLVMTSTEPLPEVVRYFTVVLSKLDAGTYQESDVNHFAYPHHESGAFTRLPLVP